MTNVDFKRIIQRYLDIEMFLFTEETHLGAHGAEETPVLIPNTEVKLGSGDYTALVGN